MTRFSLKNHFINFHFTSTVEKWGNLSFHFISFGPYISLHLLSRTFLMKSIPWLSYKNLLISFIICRSRGDTETSSFSLEILLQTLSQVTKQTGRMDYNDVHPSGQGTQRDTMFLLKCSHFSCCVEVGGMWKQLVFPRNPSTSTPSELVSDSRISAEMSIMLRRG
jgi:hypothetical protein